jgi:hypothetical protein
MTFFAVRNWIRKITNIECLDEMGFRKALRSRVKRHGTKDACFLLNLGYDRLDQYEEEKGGES